MDYALDLIPFLCYSRKDGASEPELLWLNPFQICKAEHANSDFLKIKTNDGQRYYLHGVDVPNLVESITVNVERHISAREIIGKKFTGEV